MLENAHSITFAVADIPHSITTTTTTTITTTSGRHRPRHLLFEAGKAYGQFIHDLSDFPLSAEHSHDHEHHLHETLIDFHNTPKRMQTFRNAEAEDIFHRTQNVIEEIEYIDYIESKSNLSHVIYDMLSDGRLPKRVTHNDAKLENVLFDKKRFVQFVSLIMTLSCLMGAYFMIMVIRYGPCQILLLKMRRI